MLSTLTEENVTLKVNAANWEDAITKTSEVLLKNGNITEEYVEAMIDAVHRVGPYIVIGQGIALAHARPEFGVKKMGLHFSVLDPSVPFGSEKFDPVNLVITLAALDNDSHLDLMSDLAMILMDSDNVNQLISSKTETEFITLLKEFTEE